jgi:hypothetical protein
VSDASGIEPARSSICRIVTSQAVRPKLHITETWMNSIYATFEFPLTDTTVFPHGPW